MYFSEQFKITRTYADDWFDPIITTDTKLFVDPFLIFQDDDQRWRNAHNELVEHFNTCFKLIAQGNLNPKSVPYRKALALLQFPEPREFCLGYTQSGTGGAGGGPGYALLIAEAMVDAINRGLQDLRHFEELGVLNEGIGPDRISDLTCNVLRRRFIEYTQEIALRHKIATSQVRMGGARFNTRRQAWESLTVDLPINPTSGQPILLIPERFLQELPILNADDWWENYEASQLRNDFNYDVLGNVRKKDIVEAARRHPDRVRAWAEEKEKTKAKSYDFAKDPAGVWQWEREAKSYVESAPMILAPASDDDEFIDVIELVVDKFRHYVEQQGGWKLLWNDGRKEKREEAAQLLFRGIAQHYCAANNIVLDREVNLGRGPVDFKFSNGYKQRAVLEIKKLHNGKFWHGLDKQLPSYLASDECKLGWYISIQYHTTVSSRTWLRDGPRLVAEVARKNGLQLRARSIDARPKPSASHI